MPGELAVAPVCRLDLSLTCNGSIFRKVHLNNNIEELYFKSKSYLEVCCNPGFPRLWKTPASQVLPPTHLVIKSSLWAAYFRFTKEWIKSPLAGLKTSIILSMMLTFFGMQNQSMLHLVLRVPSCSVVSVVVEHGEHCKEVEIDTPSYDLQRHGLRTHGLQTHILIFSWGQFPLQLVHPYPLHQ